MSTDFPGIPDARRPGGTNTRRKDRTSPESAASRQAFSALGQQHVGWILNPRVLFKSRYPLGDPGVFARTLLCQVTRPLAARPAATASRFTSPAVRSFPLATSPLFPYTTLSVTPRTNDKRVGARDRLFECREVQELESSIEKCVGLTACPSAAFERLEVTGWREEAPRTPYLFRR